ncbi:hypothetical protein VE02_09043 [Pseudogymnoascus sp. 03VT05]|nr:hypothetical protein VE02_09043 [Pseudogymnoascus sp. 03VT05]
MAAICFVIASTALVITSMAFPWTLDSLSNHLARFTAVTQGGVGMPAAEVTFEDIKYMLKIIIPCQALYGVCLALVKSSMMVLYYRLFGTKGSFRIAICITGAIVWAWAISIVLESFLLCSPVEFNWNPTLPSGKCGNRNVAFVMAGVLNMVTDLMVMALPLPYIWGLQLPLGRKIGLTFVFCLGLFVSAVNIIRVMSLLSIDFNDVTSTLPIPLMWSIVEQQLAIVCSGFAAIQLNDGSQQKYGLTLGNLAVDKSEISSGVARGRARPVSPMSWSEDNSGDTRTPNWQPAECPGGTHVSREVKVRSH